MATVLPSPRSTLHRVTYMHSGWEKERREGRERRTKREGRERGEEKGRGVRRWRDFPMSCISEYMFHFCNIHCQCMKTQFIHTNVMRLHTCKHKVHVGKHNDVNIMEFA